MSLQGSAASGPADVGTPHTAEPARLAFSADNVPPVIARNKWVTARYGLEDVFYPGQLLVMVTEGGCPFAKADIEMKAEMTVAEFYAFDFHGHKSYRTVDDCVVALQGYYPKSTLTVRSMLDVIGWDPEELNVHPWFREWTGPAAVSMRAPECGGDDV